MGFDLSMICGADAGGLPFSEDGLTVLLSCAIAFSGSYVWLRMIERLRNGSGALAAIRHLASALTLGGTVWATHFVGMLAMRAAFPIAYEAYGTILSLTVVIAFASLGTFAVKVQSPSPDRIMAGAVVIGIGIAGMHFLGMTSLMVPGIVGIKPFGAILSLAFGTAATFFALWMATRSPTGWRFVLSSAIMSVGICGMHYIGMYATFVFALPGGSTGDGVRRADLAIMVAAVTFSTLALAVVSAIADGKLETVDKARRNGERLAKAELEKMQSEIVRRLCAAGRIRDDDTGQHVARMSGMAHRLAHVAGAGDELSVKMREASALHDIGKIGIPDSVLLKPGKLDEWEWEVMKRHADIGVMMLSGSGMPLLDLASEIAGNHHERWDGTGYPLGLSGEAIPLSSRIVAIVDVFDALRSRRPYKEPWTDERALEHVASQRGKHFDPRLVDVFMENVRWISEPDECPSPR